VLVAAGPISSESLEYLSCDERLIPQNDDHSIRVIAASADADGNAASLACGIVGIDYDSVRETAR